MASRMVEVQTSRTPATLRVGDIFPVDDSGYFWEARAIETLADGSIAVELSQALPERKAGSWTKTFAAAEATTRWIPARAKIRRSEMRPAGPFTILF